VTRLVVLCLLAAHAAADPAVDIADLPPLPAEEAPASSATMLAAAAAAEDVVVGAAKREQSLGNVASAVTVISGERIRRFGYRTIGEAVAGAAGAYLVDNRLSYSIGIRGLQIPGDFNTRLLVLVDGATVNEAWGGLAGLGYDAIVAIDDIERIEVIRGPVSSLYGTNAFFGIINIVTRGATEAPRAWARTGIHTVNGVTTGAGFAAGSVHRQVRGSVHVMDRFGDTTTLEQLPGLELSGDAASAMSAGLVAAYDGTFAQVRAFRYTRQSPFAPYDVNPSGRPYQKRDTQLLIEGGHTRELSDRLTVAGRIYGNFYKFDDSAPAYDPVTASALDTAGTAQVVGAELRGRYELVAPDRLGITAGAEASYDRTLSIAFRQDDPADRFADQRFVFDVEGVYTELDAQPTDWLGLTAGLRHDRHSAFENRLSPRVALFVARPDRYGMKLLYAEGFRAASAFESYFEDRFDYASHRDIKPEVIRSLEAVVWARPRSGLGLRVSGFSWDARQVIEQLPYVDQDRGIELLRFENDARYASHGVEAEASYRDRRGWHAFGGVAFTRVGAERAGQPFAYGNVPNAPRLVASAGASTPRLLDHVHVSSELHAIGERPTRTAEDVQPPSPAWLGWNAAVYLPSLAGFDLTAGVRNLLGTRDLLPAPADYDRTTPDSILVPRVPAESRELYVKIGYSY
jgi:outer membrane receptor protein involved in Fe transport